MKLDFADIAAQCRKMGADAYAVGESPDVIDSAGFFGVDSLAYQHWREGWQAAEAAKLAEQGEKA